MNSNQKGNRYSNYQGGARPNTNQGGNRYSNYQGGARPNTPQGRSHVSINQQNYVDEAERVILALREPKRPGDSPRLALTTSKIRNLLSMTAELSTDARQIREETLTPEIQARVQYLRMRIAYEAGRERDVKDFVTQAGLLEEIRNVSSSRERLLLFCHYMEALVAYHKFYDGKD